MKKVELLSPVGNMETLYQAIHNGADAVYLAGIKYGARKFSKNFTEEELVNAISYSHLYGVKVYITVNTLIYENEVEEFLKYIKFLYQNNADALIMQDIGMINLVHQLYPNIEIHASTQCHNYENEGLNLLKKLGCSRVVLARELSLLEINNLDVDIEKEVFVYGALCICYSGCCLFSSLNGGRSGNRGECVGSCRLPYKLIKNNEEIELKDKYLLSTKELNTIEYLDKILESNIDSLKIEGRMKSSFYVGYVTRIYRMLIDKYYNNEPLNITKEEEDNLKVLYNRKFTKGFLFGENNITNIKTPNHQGIEIGKIIKLDRNKIYIKLLRDINQEDGIRFKRSNKGMIINKLYNQNNLLVNHVSKGQICIIDNKLNIKEKEEILKTIDNRLIKELENYNKKKIPITYSCLFKLNKPYTISISDGNVIITEEGDIVERAITNSVTRENIIVQLRKLGSTPFILDDIDIEMDNNIFVNLKALNETRRNLVEKLINKRIAGYMDRKINKREYCSYIRSNNNYTLNVLVRNKEQLEVCLENNIDNIYVTDYKLYEKYKYLNNIYYRTNRIGEKHDFRNENLLVGDLTNVYKYQNNNLVGDYYLNVTNSESIKTLNSFNVSKVTLSVELDKYRIKDILDKDYNVELIIYGRLELMVMKHCILKNNLNYCDRCKLTCDKFYLEDRDGNRYPIIRDNCINYIMHHTTIDKIKDLEYYKNIKIKNYRIELFEESKIETENIINEIKNILNK